MTGKRPDLTVIAGSGPTEKIALSLVHPIGRIDVPVTAIHSIEVHEYSRFMKRRPPFPIPQIEVRFRYDISVRLRRLTREIVGEPLEIFVGGKLVSKPILRQPFGGIEHLCIGLFDLDEAHALAAQLRTRCGITRPRAV
ncbi:MAG TPA: hypothetical protein VHX43_16295 [Xanthobacteraceae bacterium]|jgi:hypothetical protein|nr:hypothetical protein [Xanthobacteraceae bacterium]